MERAGNEDLSDDAERKGLGTPATRADIIEKLVKDGYVTREKKQMIPTEDGMKLITVLPDVVKSPCLTAKWENALTLVAKGQMERAAFMADIENMVSDLVKTYHEVSEDQKEMFSKEKTGLGKCPKCKSEVKKGKYGPYCSGKCGMHFGKIMGHALTEKELTTLLEGKKIFVKGLKGNSGKAFDAYLTPTGTEEYRYQDEEGKTHEGSRFSFALSFPKKEADRKKKQEREK